MKFGTSGLRGLVTELTDEACAAYARAFLRALPDRPAAALVGRDLRPSSPRMAAACLEAIRAAGAEAVDCGALPTPALAQAALTRGAPAIMVTGSHIPFDRNGLKFYRADGEIDKQDEARILAALEGPAEDSPRGALRADPDAAAAYLAARTAFFGADALDGMTIGVWQHSAVGRDLLCEALSACGAEVVALGRSDAFVPVDTEAVDPAAAAQAQDWIAAHGLDALVSTDGDGDRPLVFAANGAMVRGDLLGLIAARALGVRALATPISSNTAIELSGAFETVTRTRIGSPFVIEAMAALPGPGPRAGFEANGGFLLGDAVTGAAGARLAALPTRDSLTPMLAALRAGRQAEGGLPALLAALPARATASDRLKEIPSERSAALLAELGRDADKRAAFCAQAGLPAPEGVDQLDGLRMMLADGAILHLRASGNAPELRCYAEAATQTRAEEIMRAGLASAKAALAG